MLIISTIFILILRYKSNSSYFNEYVTNNYGSSNDDSLNSTQISHVIKDIQNLSMNTNHFHYISHKDRVNGNLLSKKDNKFLETLSKDSGLQSNGDVDSGKFQLVIQIYILISEINDYFFLLKIILLILLYN